MVPIFFCCSQTLNRGRTGEVRSDAMQHVRRTNAAALVHVWYLISRTRRQIDHGTEAYVPTLLRNVMYKYEGDKAYGFISTPPSNDAYWTELRKGMIPTFFLRPVGDGPTVVWTHGFPLSRLALLQLS